MSWDYVHIKTASADRPVYHRHTWTGDRSHWNEGEDVGYAEWVEDWYERMDCGFKMPLTSTFIQRERADLFARACRHCFKEEFHEHA